VVAPEPTPGNRCRKRGRPRDPLLEQYRLVLRAYPPNAKSRRALDHHAWARTRSAR
jgi:hypothetical protein